MCPGSSWSAGQSAPLDGRFGQRCPSRGTFRHRRVTQVALGLAVFWWHSLHRSSRCLPAGASLRRVGLDAFLVARGLRALHAMRETSDSARGIRLRGPSSAATLFWTGESGLNWCLCTAGASRMSSGRARKPPRPCRTTAGPRRPCRMASARRQLVATRASL